MRFILVFIMAALLSAACQQKKAETTVSTDTPETPEVDKLAFIKEKESASIIDLKRALLLLQDKKYIAIDLRTPKEIADGKIGDAMEIDFRADNFKEEIGKLDKDGSYIIYCQSGGRSGEARDIMAEMGFTDFYDMDGGYSAYASMEKAAK